MINNTEAKHISNEPIYTLFTKNILTIKSKLITEDMRSSVESNYAVMSNMKIY